VPIAHAAPSTDTMNRTRIDVGVRRPRLLYQSTNQASMPRHGIKVMIWKTRQKMKDSPENDMMAVGRIAKVLREKRCLLWSSCQLNHGRLMPCNEAGAMRQERCRTTTSRRKKMQGSALLRSHSDRTDQDASCFAIGLQNGRGVAR
jgi:hypothetical protein